MRFGIAKMRSLRARRQPGSPQNPADFFLVATEPTSALSEEPVSDNDVVEALA